MYDSVIICDEAITSYEEETNFIPTIFNKKASFKMQNFYILLACLLITIPLLTVVSIYKISSKTKTFITILIHK